MDPEAMPAWLRALEAAQAWVARAMRQLAEAGEPVIDLTPGGEAARAALVAIYAAIDQRSDPLIAAREALGAVGRASEALAPAQDDPRVAAARDDLENAKQHVLVAERELGTARVAPPRTPAPLRASRDAIALNEVARESLAPPVRVPAMPPPPPLELPPLSAPKNVGELAETMAQVRERAAARRRAREERAAARLPGPPAESPIHEAPAGFRVPIDPPLTPVAFARDRARDILEEVAMIGSQRRLQRGDEWRTVSFLDQRLLASVDAFASLGAPGLHALEELVLDSPAKDPARAFAAAILLGATVGRDALAAAERIIRYLGPADREVASYAADAFLLIPHPNLGRAMRGLLGDEEPALRELAVEVLAARGLADESELGRAARDDDAGVRRAALVALALHAPRHVDLPTLLVQAVEHPETRAAGWLAMALASHPRALSEPMEALDDDPDAAAAVALVCDHAASMRLVERMTANPTLELVDAVGWCGPSEAVVPLIDVLGQRDEALTAAAAHALDRITGAQLYQEVEVDPEQVIVPDAPVPDTQELEPPPPPLAIQVSDPRDAPSEGSPDTIVRATTERRAWRDWWRQHKRTFEPEQRYRRGKPYRPAITLWELDRWVVPGPERRRLFHELVVRTGRYVPFHPLDLVTAQERALAAWEAVVAQATTAGWTRPSRKLP